MSDDPSDSKDSPKVQAISEAVVAADHTPAPGEPPRVAPATGGERNRIRTIISPIACWRAEDVFFDFDSSYIKPHGAREIAALRDLREKHKLVIGDKSHFPPLSIFGHADPIANDDYNKKLSGRRAAAIYGLLTRDTELWEHLFSEPYGGDSWGKDALFAMAKALRAGSDSGPPAPPSPEDVKVFQQSHGLPADGNPGPATRPALFRGYMDLMCGADFVLDKKQHFLARGAHAGGKGDYQGCGEFNPVLMFSKKENEKYRKPENKGERDADNEPNRRVLIYLFRPLTRVLPDRWPCPSAQEGSGGCRNRFWSDAEKRRTFQEKRRENSETHDTFACRFYDRMAGRSPCEIISRTFKIKLYGLDGKVIRGAFYRLTLEGQEPREDFAKDGIIIIRGIPDPTKCVIEWGNPPKPGADPVAQFVNMILLDPLEATGQEDRRKLNNLGYTSRLHNDNVAAFQQDYRHRGLTRTGIMDAQTRAVLNGVHDGCPDDLENSTEEQPTP
jgi:hypothetical protein